MTGWRWLPLFATLMLSFLMVVQLFFLRMLANYLRARGGKAMTRYLAYSLFALFNIPLLVIIVIRPSLSAMPDWFLFCGIYPFYIWHFALVMIFLALAMLELLKLPFRLARVMKRAGQQSNKGVTLSTPENPVGFSFTRRLVLERTFFVLAGSAFAGSAVGMLRRDKYEMTAVSLPVRGLPENFQGFSIALLSDIHSSIFMQREKMQRYAAEVNSLGADLIAVPGDFVNSMFEEVHPFAEAFWALHAPFGVYGVLGNHDYFTRQVEKVAREVDGCGIKLLRNQAVTIRKENSVIHLLGIDDTGNQDLASGRVRTMVEQIAAPASKILLCHRPYYFQRFADLQIDVTLSGHTHGGQIVFGQLEANIIAPARMVSPYVAGLYTISSSHMYVSRGIGTVGVPIRINCPPEITKITLLRE